MPTNSTLAVPPGSTPYPLRFQLGVMLFFQYFVQGAYLPVASLYLQKHLGFTPFQVGLFGSAVVFGALLAPVIAGQVADRYVSTERFLALSHFLGGIIMLLIWRQTTAGVVLTLTFIYSLLYVPTISLTNTMCFRNLRNREQEFPVLRSFGTIGFIAAQWLFELAHLAPLKDEPAQLLAARGDAFFLSGAGGVFLAAYCLFLPKTPPIPSAVTKFAPVEALRLLADRGFLVLFLISLPIAVVHTYHFVWISPYLAQDTGIPDEWIGRVTTVGQIFEILVLALLGLGLKRMGFKWTLVLGITAYVLRNLIFAAAPPVPVVVAAQALHGFCFACFFATAFMLVDRLAPEDARASVQTFFNIIALGVGMLIGGWFAGLVGQWFTDPSTKAIDYSGVWLTAAAVSAASLLVFLAAFPSRPLAGEEKTINSASLDQRGG